MRAWLLKSSVLLLLWAAPALAAAQGNVSVLYAGSLGALMEKTLGPAFQQATGYHYQGEGQGSVAAAKAIRDHLREPDVFISADPVVNDNILMGPKNGSCEDWYLTLAAGELVIGYNQRSRFRDAFEQARAGKLPWYESFSRPGVKIGRTDPNLDPKGYRTLSSSSWPSTTTGSPGWERCCARPPIPTRSFPSLSC